MENTPAEQAHPWQKRETSGVSLRFAGFSDVGIGDICRFFSDVDRAVLDSLSVMFSSITGQFGLIAESPDYIIAATDRTRSYPIFYAGAGGGTVFSASAREIRDLRNLTEPDHTSLLEFLMAGYVTGPYTVYEGMRQLQAGEVAVWVKSTGELDIKRYYEFLGSESTADEEQLIEELAALTEQTFRRVVQDAGDRPVYVPLSGGLDSRLIICMLKEQGAKDLRAFSYAPPGNHEAIRAKAVAERLQVPWNFYPSTRASARKLFQQDACQEYWRFSDGLASVPNMQEYQILAELKSCGALPAEAIVINGQTGDFISGDHIPSGLVSPQASDDELFEAVLKKHFSLWKMLKTHENLGALRVRFEQNLAPAREKGATHAGKLFEFWEWQERQAKFVVNQQRGYDFFSLDWTLPLWDREYCDFWCKVPVELKFNQKLYRDFLQRWDYAGLFTDPKLARPIVRWPGATIAVMPLARAVGLIGGRRCKDYVYNHLKYFGHYSNQFGCYPLDYFLKRANELRNPTSLFGEHWVRQRFPNWMNEHFPIKA